MVYDVRNAPFNRYLAAPTKFAIETLSLAFDAQHAEPPERRCYSARILGGTSFSACFNAILHGTCIENSKILARLRSPTSK